LNDDVNTLQNGLVERKASELNATGSAATPLAVDPAALWRTVLRSSFDPIILVNAEGIIQAVSDSVERVFGWPSDALIGESLKRFIPLRRDDVEDVCADTNTPLGYRAQSNQTCEMQAVRKDGTVIPVELSICEVPAEPDHDRLFTCIVRDLSRRRQIERSLRESERRLREILEKIELVGVMLDTSGNIIFCNDYLLHLTGWAREELLGCSWFERLIPECDYEQILEIFRQSTAGGNFYPHHENDILTRDGERRTIAWSNVCIRDIDGTIVGVTALGVDVTAQRSAEARLAEHQQNLEQLVDEKVKELAQSQSRLRMADRLASIGTLATGLGHDMYNMLLPARCRLDALMRQQLPDDLAEEITGIRESVEQLHRLSKGLRFLAKNPEDRAESSEATVLHEWWQQVGPLLKRGVPKHATLHCEIPDDLPPVAVASHQIMQIALNLLINAGEAVRRHGNVRIWARKSEDPEAPGVQFGVTDDGLGMTEQVRRRAMDPFFTTKKRGLSTGLGLSLVHSIADAIGSHVHIDSAPGEGTTVSLTLPVQKENTGDAGAAGESHGHAVVRLHDPRTAGVVTMLLQAEGYEVLQHESEKGGADNAALLVTEGDATGVEDARQFLARDENRRVVVLTANGETVSLDGPTIVADRNDIGELRRAVSEATH